MTFTVHFAGKRIGVQVARHSGPLYDPAWLWSVQTTTAPIAGGIALLLADILRPGTTSPGLVHWHFVVVMLPLMCLGVLCVLGIVRARRDRAAFTQLLRAVGLAPLSAPEEVLVRLEGDEAELLRVIQSPPRAVADAVDADVRPASSVVYLLLVASLAIRMIGAPLPAPPMAAGVVLGAFACMVLSGVLTVKRYDVRGGVLWIRPLGLNRVISPCKQIDLRGASVVCSFQDELLQVTDREKVEHAVSLPAAGSRHKLVIAVLSNAVNSEAHSGP